MFNKLPKGIKAFKDKMDFMQKELSYIREALGRIEAKMCRDEPIEDSEFRAYSQWGEDGIIQHLVNHVDIKRKIFIEFGVENYTEANTRFLLINNNWSGLIIDGSKENIESIKKTELYWRYNLKAVDAFITRENINEIISRNGVGGDIGILSVDIDGNDYWIWKEINVVNPRIIICEYNSLFGCKRKLTVPYDANFTRTNYHYSNLVYGASISALNDLAEQKGYSLVAGNSAGNNVFFVRNDLVSGAVRKKNPSEVYKTAQFREGRDKKGCLAYGGIQARKEAVKDCQVYDLEKKQNIRMAEVFE